MSTDHDRPTEDDLRAKLTRYHDLVRYARGGLFEANLLTDEEYATLVADHGAVARLESYDELRAELDQMRRRAEEARALLMCFLAAVTAAIEDYPDTETPRQQTAHHALVNVLYSRATSAFLGGIDD